MTPFANATTPVKAAQGTALALGAGAAFLLVASNVLLLGLRLHDGGFHWLEIATGWPRYGVDPRFDRWLTLSTLAGLIVVVEPTDWPAAVVRVAAPAAECGRTVAVGLRSRISPTMCGVRIGARTRPAASGVLIRIAVRGRILVAV